MPALAAVTSKAGRTPRLHPWVPSHVLLTTIGRQMLGFGKPPLPVMPSVTGIAMRRGIILPRACLCAPTADP